MRPVKSTMMKTPLPVSVTGRSGAVSTAGRLLSVNVPSCFLHRNGSVATLGLSFRSHSCEPAAFDLLRRDGGVGAGQGINEPTRSCTNVGGEPTRHDAFTLLVACRGQHPASFNLARVVRFCSPSGMRSRNAPRARFYCGVEQWLARQAHNLKVAGSNPAPTTRREDSPEWQSRRGEIPAVPCPGLAGSQPKQPALLFAICDGGFTPQSPSGRTAVEIGRRSASSTGWDVFNLLSAGLAARPRRGYVRRRPGRARRAG